MDATLSVQRVSPTRTSITPNLQQFRRHTSILVTDIPDKEIELIFGGETRVWGGRKATGLPFGALRALSLIELKVPRWPGDQWGLFHEAWFTSSYTASNRLGSFLPPEDQGYQNSKKVQPRARKLHLLERFDFPDFHPLRNVDCESDIMSPSMPMTVTLMSPFTITVSSLPKKKFRTNGNLLMLGMVFKFGVNEIE